MVIVIVNVVNGLFSFWQEYKAERAAEALRRLLPAHATVLRDGAQTSVLAEELVLGDVVLLGERPDVTGVAGDGCDQAIFARAGIDRADGLAAVTGSDEVNAVVARLAASGLGVPRVFARIYDPAKAWMYTPEMGVDAALNQADLIAHVVAEEISLGEMTTLLKLRRDQYALVEERVHPHAPAAGHRLGDLTLPEQCVFVAVLRDGTPMLRHPDVTLRADDEVLAVAHTDTTPALAALLTAPPTTGAGRKPEP